MATTRSAILGTTAVGPVRDGAVVQSHLEPQTARVHGRASWVRRKFADGDRRTKRLNRVSDGRHAADGGPVTAGRLSPTDDEAVRHDIDCLLARLGQTTRVVPLGQSVELQLSAGIGHTVEVRLGVVKTGQGKSSEFNTKIFSRSVETKYIPELRADPPYDLYISETLKQVNAQSHKFASVGQSTHRMDFKTDSDRVFVTLWSVKEMRVTCGVRVMAKEQVDESDHDSDGGEEPSERGPGTATRGKKSKARRPRGAGLRLAAKLDDRRQFLLFEQHRAAGDFVDDPIARANAQDGLRVRVVDSLKKAGEYVPFVLRSGDVVNPSNGGWHYKITRPEFRRAVAAYLRKAAREQRWTEVVVHGAFRGFMRQRFRELVLARAQVTVRALGWQKLLCTAAKAPLFLICLAVPREDARQAKSVWRTMTLDDSRRLLGRIRRRRGVPGARLPPRLATTAVRAAAHESDSESSSSGAGSPEDPTAVDYQKLLSIGFDANPTPVGAGGSGSEEWARAKRRGERDVSARKKQVLAELSKGAASPVAVTLAEASEVMPDCSFMVETAGKQRRRASNYRGDVVGDGSQSAALMTQAIQEVKDRMVCVSVRSNEAGHLLKGSKAVSVPEDAFAGTIVRRVERVCDILAAEQTAREAQVAEEAAFAAEPRMRLRFFNEDAWGLPWLGWLRCMVLCATGRTNLLTSAERKELDGKLRQYAAVRKAAQRMPGICPPLEASFWGLPDIVKLAGGNTLEDQRFVSAHTWKADLFGGAMEHVSSRQIDPSDIGSKGQNWTLMRRLAEIGGVWRTGVADTGVDAYYEGPVDRLATRTGPSATQRMRTMGGKNEGTRIDDPLSNLPPVLANKFDQLEAMWHQSRHRQLKRSEIDKLRASLLTRVEVAAQTRANRDLLCTALAGAGRDVSASQRQAAFEFYDKYLVDIMTPPAPIEEDSSVGAGLSPSADEDGRQHVMLQPQQISLPQTVDELKQVMQQMQGIQLEEGWRKGLTWESIRQERAAAFPRTHRAGNTRLPDEANVPRVGAAALGVRAGRTPRFRP
mmetsp:Transcript_20958/g.53316  ORF Transcript_20958/g.53316 Transcript_20958/m.53316 type:complete len:1042 (-) Transcript_20958:639-3764(-)